MNVIHHLASLSETGSVHQRRWVGDGGAYRHPLSVSSRHEFQQAPVKRQPILVHGRRLLDRLVHWQQHYMQRQKLRLLAEDPDFLHDIGISREDALCEADKVFWRD